MYDKFEARCRIAGNWKSAYSRLRWLTSQHHKRYKIYINNMVRPLICQDCHGAGGKNEVVLPETGQGPWYECGFCEGTGYVSPWVRSLWLRMKKEEKRVGRK